MCNIRANCPHMELLRFWSILLTLGLHLLLSCSSHCLPAVLPLEFCYILGTGFGESVQKMLALKAAG